MMQDIPLRRPKPGRQSKHGEPMILTSVRVTAKEWEWVKSHPGLEFSAILRSRIHQLMRDEEYKTADPQALKVQEWRKMGLNDAEIAEHLRTQT